MDFEAWLFIRRSAVRDGVHQRIDMLYDDRRRDQPDLPELEYAESDDWIGFSWRSQSPTPFQAWIDAGSHAAYIVEAIASLPERVDSNGPSGPESFWQVPFGELSAGDFELHVGPAAGSASISPR